MTVLAVRTIILYCTVIFSIRLMGKRQVGELQPSELVVAIMISDLASVPMQDIDIPLFSGIVPVLTLIVAEIVVSFLSLKSKGVRKFISGKPSIVIYKGKIDEKELERLRFHINDLLEELRTNNCYNIADVETAVLETNGKLTVIPKTEARGLTVADMNLKNPKKEGLPFNLISDGTLNEEELKRSGKDRRWLSDELTRRGIKSERSVFLASLDEDGDLFIQLKEGKKK